MLTALATLWHVCFRAHIARLKRQTVLGHSPIAELLVSGEYADCTVHAREGPPIEAHVAVLSTSPYFRAFLSFQASAVGMAEPTTAPRWELRLDEDRADLERYLEWLYTGTVGEQRRRVKGAWR